MRRWYKHWLDPDVKGKVRAARDSDFAEHAESMGGYDGGRGYGSEEEFFETYFFGYQMGRLEAYDEFLRAHLPKDAETLSIAAGRCANELYLARDGWKHITCSDLAEPPSLERARELFGELEFVTYDVLAGPAPRRYGAVVCLSLIYLFDEAELERFFANVAASLAPGGMLILDSAGSPDSGLSRFVHDVWLPLETRAKRLLKVVTERRWYGLVVKDFGWRRTDDEILGAARRAGLELTGKTEYAFLAEFRRSSILTRVLRPGSALERLGGRVGRRIPYIRMFEFRLVTGEGG